MSLLWLNQEKKNKSLWILKGAQSHNMVLTEGAKELIAVIPSEGVLFFVINTTFSKNTIAEAHLISVSQNGSEIHHS